VDAPRLLVVGRLRRPHGLKGEVTIFPLTDSPELALGQGRVLRRLDLRGDVVGEPVPATELEPPAEDEVYLYELAGFAVRREDDSPLGIVSDVFELPGGLTLEVQGPKREFLLPYRQEFIRRVDRQGRFMIVAPPEGLVED